MSKWLDFTVKKEECLVWTKCLNSDGYPRAGVKGNTNLKVHREVFYDTHGYYPAVVRHVCDNPKCINPEHLVGGSFQDNVRDKMERKRCFKQVLEEDFENCLSLREEGKTYEDIGKALNIKRKRVEYILTRWRKES